MYTSAFSIRGKWSFSHCLWSCDFVTVCQCPALPHMQEAWGKTQALLGVCLFKLYFQGKHPFAGARECSDMALL